MTELRRAQLELSRLAQEQAAFRRVATMVVAAGTAEEILATVAEEVAELLGADHGAVWRYETDGRMTLAAFWTKGDRSLPVGTHVELEGDSVAALVRKSGRPRRLDNYDGLRGPVIDLITTLGARPRSAVGAPILAEGRTWGALAAMRTSGEYFAEDTESRLVDFAELVSMAIANAAARSEAQRLADEQAALRRVATLVAQGVSPSSTFDAVAAEMIRVLGSDGVTLSRYEPDEEVTVIAHRGPDAERVPAGTQTSHGDGDSVTAKVWRSKRPARFVHVEGAPGAVPALARRMGVRSAVGAPIVVDGRLWGVVIANWRHEASPPEDTEERMTKFVELLDTAIANADGRDQLTASRARLVTEADEARRRVVRDLHDGAQQRLVQTIVTLKLAQRALGPNNESAAALIAEALSHAERGNGELRELAHGILPALLTQSGLRSGISSIMSRLDLPVEVDVPSERFPAEIEASAYFVVAEALTNVVKHAHADWAAVRVFVRDDTLHVEVRDNGVGGANPRGHGLVGLSDRVTALEGRLTVVSPAQGGTVLTATLPLRAD